MSRIPHQESAAVPSSLLHKFAALAVLVAAADISARAQTPAAQNFNDAGTFVVSYAGRPIGTEKFSIRSSGKQIEAEGQISLHYNDSGKTVDLETQPKLILDAALKPLAYTWEEKSPDSNHLEVDFRSSPVRSTLRKSDGKEDIREFNFGQDLVVLDDNVVHHYELLALRYLQTPGGVRTYTGYIPQEALPGQLSVSEASAGKSPGQEKDQKHLIVATESLRVDLWVDGAGRVERVSFPSAQIEAVRKK